MQHHTTALQSHILTFQLSTAPPLSHEAYSYNAAQSTFHWEEGERAFHEEREAAKNRTKHRKHGLRQNARRRDSESRNCVDLIQAGGVIPSPSPPFATSGNMVAIKSMPIAATLNPVLLLLLSMSEVTQAANETAASLALSSSQSTEIATTPRSSPARRDSSDTDITVPPRHDSPTNNDNDGENDTESADLMRAPTTHSAAMDDATRPFPPMVHPPMIIPERRRGVWYPRFHGDRWA